MTKLTSPLTAALATIAFAAVSTIGCDTLPDFGTQLAANTRLTRTQRVPVTGRIHCGDVHVYTNTSGKREYVSFSMTNGCEFTAYLWINFPSGGFILKDIAPGGSFSQATWLPPNGEIEFECTLVASVDGTGCRYSHAVLARR